MKCRAYSGLAGEISVSKAFNRRQTSSLPRSGSVNDAFILSLFQKIEQGSDNVDDPYHYPVIRVLVNETHFPDFVHHANPQLMKLIL